MPRARGFGGACGSILRTVLKLASSSQALHSATRPICVYQAMALTLKRPGSTWLTRGPRREGRGIWGRLSGGKKTDRVGIPSTPSGGMINAGLYARGDQVNRMVPIFLALKASRRRFPFTDPFKRGIGASCVVPLYARRNDTLISKDAWSIWNLCLLLAQRPELQFRLGEPIRMENLLRDLTHHRLPVVRVHLGIRTESVEIRTALRRANIVHPLGGRPGRRSRRSGPSRSEDCGSHGDPRIPRIPKSCRNT